MSTPDWTDEYREQIADCRKRERQLSAWDVDFLASIEERLDDRRPLSQKQINCLDDIWERVTRRG
jgi:hypothetical protein